MGFIRWLMGVFALLALAGSVALADSLPAADGPRHIAAELLAEPPTAPGRPVTLALHFTPAPGWHGYWLNPGDAGFAMRLDWHLPAGAHVGGPQYPVPQTFVLSGLMNHVFTRDYAVLVPLTGAAAGAKVSVDASWLACSDQICVPEKATIATVINTGAHADPRFDGWRAALPAPLGAGAHFAASTRALRLAVPLPASVALGQPHLFVAADHIVDYAAPQGFARKGDVLLVTLARAPNTAGTAATPAAVPAVLRLGDGQGLAFTATPGPVPSGGVSIGGNAPDTSPAGLAALVLAALAGGLLLNVMPCVFPILSLKALSLARAGESAKDARSEGLAYSAGVVLACVALGGLLLALRAGGEAVGWAFQLQQPGVVAVLVALAVALTANFAGVFEFAVPGFAAAGGGSKGAFATGLLTAFVATPCTGPFMAGAMGAALLLPVAPALLLFAALGLGMALPFLAIAFIAPLRRLLPRPGGWMVWFRRLMAVPMALTALALVWLASRLGGRSFAGLCAVLGFGVFALLSMVGGAQRAGRAVAPSFAGGLAVLALLGAVALPLSLRPPSAEGADLLPAQPWSPAAMARAQASGHPVFAFFTADWCLTCKVNERLAIETPATRDAFARAHVVVLKGDWTRRSADITRYLTAQGAAGVPLYVWVPAHGGAAQLLPQVLSSDALARLAAGG